MATATKLGAIRPDLKAMIDNVIVPILVREYVAMLRNEKRVEVTSQAVPPYGLANTTLAEKVAG
jgi:hypothetical protein